MKNNGNINKHNKLNQSDTLLVLKDPEILQIHFVWCEMLFSSRFIPLFSQYIKNIFIILKWINPTRFRRPPKVDVTKVVVLVTFR